jgi:hypothetical protein
MEDVHIAILHLGENSKSRHRFTRMHAGQLALVVYPWESVAAFAVEVGL